jgi:hypothetical protein
MKHGLTAWSLLIGCAACPLHPSLAAAQKSPEVIVSPGASDLKLLTGSEYLANIAQMQTLVESCKANAAACDPTQASGDFLVGEAGGERFTIRRDWLRAVLADAKNANDTARAELMAQSAARLRDDAAEASAPAPTSPDAPAARAKANAILSGDEFRSVQQVSWFTQQVALFSMWLARWLNGAFSKLPRSPWLVPLLEGGGLLCAIAGLLVWAWRTTRRQRLALAVPAAERQLLWQRESDDWARRAEEQAAAGDWREAVHCLYWSAIVLLEGRRFWRANRARTPREYLPLLESGTPRHAALGGLTRLFERIWYGLRPATQSDFERAQALLEALKAA